MFLWQIRKFQVCYLFRLEIISDVYCFGGLALFKVQNNSYKSNPSIWCTSLLQKIEITIAIGIDNNLMLQTLTYQNSILTIFCYNYSTIIRVSHVI